MIFHESKDFVRNLDKFLFDANPTSSAYLNSNRSKVPVMFRNYSSTLYRGMFLSKKEFEDLTNGKFSLGRVTSWTKDKKIAEKFLNDPKFVFQNRNSDKVIFQKKFSQTHIILDIDAYVSFYGEKKLMELGFDEMNIDSAIKEKEVLIAPVKIGMKEFIKII